VESTEDVDDNSDEAQDATDIDTSNNSFSEMAIEDPAREHIPMSVTEDTRATFNFSLNDNAANSEPFAEQEATLLNFFGSPVKHAPPAKSDRAANRVEYPELPQSPVAETEMVDAVEEKQTELHVEAATIPSPAKIATQDESIEVIAMEHKYSPVLGFGQDILDEELRNGTTPVETTKVFYPSLPEEVSVEQQTQFPENLQEREDEEMFEVAADIVPAQFEEEDDHYDSEVQDDEDFTEASLQLELSRELAKELKKERSMVDGMSEKQQEAVVTNQEIGSVISTELSATAIKDIVADMTDGLTLGPSKSFSRESPAQLSIDIQGLDETMTVALDDDTAMLKDFLSRAAASRASKAAVISRRESAENRRDSDVIRHALASPRKVLEDKDPNSPSKYDNDATLDLSQTLTLSMPQPPPLSPTQEQADVEDADETATKSSRRSSRTRKSRLPAPSSTTVLGPSKIAVRRADGGEPVVLKKSEAQELGHLTRTNTRKNKQGAFAVNLRLAKLSHDASARAAAVLAAGAEDNLTESVVQVPGKKYVRWDEQLAYYQEGTDTIANMLADAESLATPDELSLPGPPTVKKARIPKKEKPSTSTPKIKRVRGLGTTNGTPSKALLLTPASLLPDAVQDELDTAPSQQRLPKPKVKTVKPKSSKITKLATAPNDPLNTKLPILDVAPVGIESTIPASSSSLVRERKSRLATPRKVKLPNSVVGEGKENQTLLRSSGIVAAGSSKIGVPGSGGVAETGLPRRRARKV
jgi:hypothetical protein